MRAQVAVISSSTLSKERLAHELRECVAGAVDFDFVSPENAQLILIDGRNAPTAIEAALGTVERRGRAVFALLNDGDPTPEALLESRLDDVLVHPFRKHDILSKLRQIEQLALWHEVSQVNESIADIAKKLQGDLELATRLQKAKLPVRFPDLKGMKVSHRFMAGNRSGGDHFDIAESSDQNTLAMVMTDSSSYGLSGAILSVLMKVALKLTVNDSRSCRETVRRIKDEILLTLNERDKLSLFYATLSRRDYRLRYLNLGSSSAFLAKSGGRFEVSTEHGPSITRSGILDPKSETEVVFAPGDRFVILTDGFTEIMGGPQATVALLDDLRLKDANDTINELVYRVKSRLASRDDLPEQDCTGAVFDFDKNLIRLA